MDANIDLEELDVIDRVTAEWATERPDLDVSPLAVFARLARVRTLAEQRIEDLLERFGLTLGSFDVLVALRRAGAPYQRTPTELASASLLTSGGVTFRLDRLEQAGLIRRVPSPDDRRVMYGQLTAEGRDLADRVMGAHIANETRMLSGLSEDEVQDLARLLRRLEHSIRSSQSSVE